MAENPPVSRSLPDGLGGRYRIVSRLGVGGMGVVYKATDTQLHRSVAIKALEERRLHIPGAAARLRSEALAAASLDHPYICKVYELIETPADTFIVMEFVEGETLASMLTRGKLPIVQVLQLGREIAEGLANAHARGLVHRDVKPGNVMVTPHGHVKLLDFGIAGADVESPSTNETRTLSPQLTLHTGTPQYMAPEQATGKPVTTRADLFSLGVLLYECVTGQLPFSGTTTFDYVRHVMQSAPRRLDRVAPETPAALADLIDHLLEKQPADRPASAEAVVSDLRSIQDALTAPTGGVSTVQQALARRRRRWVALAALAVAAGVVTWRWLASRPSSADLLWQSRPFVTTSAIEFGSRVSPNADWLSFIATSGGTSRILVQRIDGGESRPLTLGPGEPISQIWSPDGNQIACALILDGAPVLQIYPAFFGGAVTKSVAIDKDLVPNSVQLIRWIGRDVYFRADARGGGMVVRRLALDQPGAAVSVSDAWKIDGNLRGADVRPDGGAAVIAVHKDGQEDLWTLNLDGSSLRPLTADAPFDKDPLWIGDGERVAFQSNRGGQTDLWQIDVRSKALLPLVTGEAEEVAESSSADGRILSVQRLSQDANLWLFGADAPRQLTQDSLNDYSPVLSADGRLLAFQRSQPTPSRGYTILDSRIFVAPFEGRGVPDAKAEADGFAPDLSTDGQWLAYLQTSDVPRRMTLSVRDLRGGATILVSNRTQLPSLTLSPVEWANKIMAWSPAGADLYFVDWPSDHQLRRYRAGEPAPQAPFVTVPDAVQMRDLYASPDSGHLGYITSSRDIGIVVHELDPLTSASRELARFTLEPGMGSGVFSRGWIGRQLVLVRYSKYNPDGTTDIDIVLTGGGATRTAGRITQAFASTIRLHAARRTLYVTRAEQGTSNVFAFSLDTGALSQVTQNTLPGVRYSGFQPFSQGTLGVREERREDIWLMQQGAPPRSGNPAGR
ncbi:MAG TPA: protein kinase [Vicinamibacterales bacterium]|nr:protein kinase [Vicinamibacterales bacterium]